MISSPEDFSDLEGFNVPSPEVELTAEGTKPPLFIRKLSHDEFFKSEEFEVIKKLMPLDLIKELLKIENDREFSKLQADYFENMGDDCGICFYISTDPWKLYNENFDELQKTQTLEEFQFLELDKSSWLPNGRFIFWDVKSHRVFYKTRNGNRYIKDFKYHLLTTLEGAIADELSAPWPESIKSGGRKAYNKLRLLISSAKLSQYNF